LAIEPRRRERPVLALVVGYLLLAGASRGAELSGSLELVSGTSGRPARGVEIGDAGVAFIPDPAVPYEAPETPYEMATVRKAFAPQVLVVPVGATVVFPNNDPILHNVFSVTPGNAFDVGVYGRGEGKLATFLRGGLVRVFCNVHQDMFGHILVLDTPFFQKVDADGSFAIHGLPDTRGRIVLWHPQAQLESLPVSRPRTGLALELEAERRRVPPHLNKFGKPYRSRRDRYNG
jgi:plastocyanin